MTEQERQAYLDGEHMAWSMIAEQCIQHLNSETAIKAVVSYLIERNEAVVKLRDLCRDFGDNSWDDSLHLADIIEKNLARHLYNNFERTNQKENRKL